jgi:enoyl-CoA hydratase/carnithine racemase
MDASPQIEQLHLHRVSPAYWRITFDNPPLNLMGPDFVMQFRDLMSAIESDAELKVVVFDSAVEGFFLNHSNFRVNLQELTRIPQGPTGLEAWPDILVRLTRAPVVSIAEIRGRATGNGSELLLSCDMSFVGRETAVISQWEAGAALIPGGGPMARLPRAIGRSRALEVLLTSDDLSGDTAELFGYVNRCLPDAELGTFVDAIATRIASFDKWALANIKRLVNAASLPAEVEIAAGWDAFLGSIARPAAQKNISTLLDRGFQQPGDLESRLGATVGQLGRPA